MRINRAMEYKISKLLDHTELCYTEIAEAVGVSRRDIETYVRRRVDDITLSDDELACRNPTAGFLYYLQGGDDD